MIAFEKEYRAYRDVVSAGIQALRPGTEVVTVELEDLEEALARFDPQLVVCGNRHYTEQLFCGSPWIELSMDPTKPTKFFIDGDVSEHTNPTLDTMLSVIDELKRRVAQASNQLDETTA